MAMARHLSENKVYFTVNESKGPFKFRGVSYQIDLPERVHPGDMVVAMIDPSKKTAVYVRQISSSVHINPHNMPRMESQAKQPTKMMVTRRSYVGMSIKIYV